MAKIIYCSNTGSAKKYAEALSAKTGFECIDIAQRDSVSPDEEIIFIGWVMAGALQGLKEVRESFKNIKLICAVGMMKSDKAFEDMKKKNAIEENCFFLTGDFSMDKLKGMYKMMMGMMLKMLKSKIKESGDEKGDEMLALFEKGIEGFDEAELEPVMAFLGYRI